MSLNTNMASDNIISMNSAPWATTGKSLFGMSVGVREAMDLAGCNFEAEGRPLFMPAGGPDDIVNFEAVPTHKAVVRKGDGKLFGVVGEGLAILQPWEMFSFVDDLQAANVCKLVAAGQFKDGKKIWIQAEIGTSEIVPGDEHKRLLTVSNVYDGSASHVAGFSDLRIICMNSFMRASKEAAKSGFSIRHTDDMRNRIEIAKQSILIAGEQAKEYEKIMRGFLKMRMTSSMWEEFAGKLIPAPKGEEAVTTRSDNARDTLISLAIKGKGQDLPGVAGTAYAAFNALTEYVNFERTSRGKTEEAKQASRYESTLFGSGGKMMNQGFDILGGMLAQNAVHIG